MAQRGSRVKVQPLCGALVAIAVLFGAVACSSDSKGARDEPRKDATVNVDADFDARQRAYLDVATQSLAPGDALSVLAHFERAARDPQFEFDPATVTPEAFAPTFEAIDAFDDTTDFDVLYLLNLWYAYGDKLPPATRDAIAKRFVAFKYWYTEPTPKGIVDNKYYWSENHRIIYHVDEYLAGLAFKDATFTNDGRTGAAHAETAKKRILQWLEEKVRFGFTEWHSDVYYQKDVTPLLTLVEFAPDPDLANRAAMVLDLFLLDIALHLQKGNFGATHGRSYMKDKSNATDQNTFTFSKLLFDDSTLPYEPGADPGGTLFARAKNYAIPPVIRTIARDDTPIVDQEHMNVPLDPNAPVVPDPAPPFGISFDDPENVPFWWERGAQTAWQTVPLTIHALDKYHLWDSQFYKPFKPLRDAVGNDMVTARTLAQQLSPVLAFALLSEVHSYTYRARDVMLSTAQDYRPGVFAEQEHAWQATLDEKAIVFTTHPKNEPQQGTEWPDDDGYWTGTGSIPRSAQYRTVGFHIYSPQFEPMGPPFDSFSYLDYTHAYFPQEYFDEVRQSGNWTFGRKGDGYVALWSQRAPEWRTHDPAKVFTHGLTKPFDLVARGGPDNVWIVEMGDAAKWKTFDVFRRAITDAPVKVAAGAEHAVDYTSPTEGRMTFGFSKPLTVAGKGIDLHPSSRLDNPYVQVPFEGKRYDVKAGDMSLRLDFDAWTRKVGGG
jgi:hypothetical protein